MIDEQQKSVDIVAKYSGLQFFYLMKNLLININMFGLETQAMMCVYTAVPNYV